MTPCTCLYLFTGRYFCGLNTRGKRDYKCLSLYTLLPHSRPSDPSCHSPDITKHPRILSSSSQQGCRISWCHSNQQSKPRICPCNFIKKNYSLLICWLDVGICIIINKIFSFSTCMYLDCKQGEYENNLAFISFFNDQKDKKFENLD